MDKTRQRIYFIARVGIWSALAAILYCVPVFHFSLPGFPTFLEIHLDEIPIFIAGYFYGPFSSLAIILIKTIIKLPFTSTMCIGELCDLIYSSFFILPAVFIFSKWKNKKGLIIGLIVGTLCQLLSSFFINIYAMFPFYEWAFKINVYEIVKAINPNVTNGTYSVGLIVILPFNAIKDSIVLGITLVVSLILFFATKRNKKTPTGTAGV